MRTARFIGSVVALLASVLVLLLPAEVATAEPADASVGCYGDWCSGMDPEATGCSRDAVTVGWADTTGARLELRWSQTCQTNWARYIQYERGWYMGNVPLELRAVQDTGYTQRLNYGVNGTPEGVSWTPMIYSPQRWVHAEMVYQCHGVGECFVDGVVTGDAFLRTQRG